jgi:hypothetical protein
MRIQRQLFFAFLLWPLWVSAQNAAVIDPNDIQLGPYQYKELPTGLLKRIRATTNVFEKIDGMTYEKAVDLYKRDLNPEDNLVVWEAMVKAYITFCASRCATDASKGMSIARCYYGPCLKNQNHSSHESQRAYAC